MTLRKAITVHEILKHNNPEDCWIVVDDNVWDITSFAAQHPGGAAVIYQHSGRDATAAYSEVHAASLIGETLGDSNFKGRLDRSTVDPDWQRPPPTATPQLVIGEKPPLDSIINADDFEKAAKRSTSKKAWAFYSSAATDLITRDANKSAFNKIWFRPRILRNVRDAHVKSTILGCDVELPIFVAPASMAKLVHPDGEKVIAEGCRRSGIPQCISTSASYPMSEIIPSVPRGSTSFFFQLYVNKDRRQSEALLRKAEELGCAAVFVTVDVPVAGKREEDERVKADEGTSAPMSGQSAKNDLRGGGLGRLLGGFIDSTLSWADIAWVRKHTRLPIVLKGVQTAADAKLALQYGVDGIVVSNHGGRSLDGSPPAILVLLELQKNCPEVLDRMEVFIDGGVRRGTDVLKALCLGATAVALGRPFLYAANYGPDGVEHLVNIIKDELETSMRLIGVTDLKDLHPGYVNTLGVDHLIPTTQGHPYARCRAKPRL